MTFSANTLGYTQAQTYAPIPLSNIADWRWVVSGISNLDLSCFALDSTQFRVPFILSFFLTKSGLKTLHAFDYSDTEWLRTFPSRTERLGRMATVRNLRLQPTDIMINDNMEWALLTMAHPWLRLRCQRVFARISIFLVFTETKEPQKTTQPLVRK